MSISFLKEFLVKVSKINADDYEDAKNMYDKLKELSKEAKAILKCI